jgi:antagonist of KipI
MTIEIIETGPMVSIQDLGRKGFERFGVPPSGPMDRFSFMAANLLVGNLVHTAELEMSLMPLRLRCWQDGLAALCGRGFELYKNGIKQPIWTAVSFHYGDELFLPSVSSGWAVLAFSGGVIVPEVLGSKATYARAGLGGKHGKNLQTGDLFVTGTPPCDPMLQAGASLPAEIIPEYGDQVKIGVVLGPHLEFFAKESISLFTSTPYRVGFDSDRMGYRLSGESLPMVKPADILSEGLVMGAIQVPSSGQPMVMLADRPATGGYARIGTVISADLPLLVQSIPGETKIQFVPVDVETAQKKYKQQIKTLLNAVTIPTWNLLTAFSGALD